jgi:signal transduction histidine kinase
MGLQSRSLSAMKQSLSSPSSPDEVEERLQDYSVKLMQHQEEPAKQLVQQINQIIAASESSVVLQQVATELGVAFEVDCCLMTLIDNTSSEATTANWSAVTHLGLAQPDEIFSMEELDLPVVQCASEPLTIEDIATIENSLVVGSRNLPLPIKSVLAINARFGGKTNGVVCLIKSQPYEWSQKEKQILKALEIPCAIAFSQVAQAKEIAAQQKFVETCAQHQSLIKQLTILSRSNLELNQMLQLVCTASAEALQADRGLLLLLKYSDPLFRIRQRRQIPKAKATAIGEWFSTTQNPNNIKLSEDDKSFWLADCTLSQRAYSESGKPFIVSETTEDIDISTVAPLFALDKLKAALMVPIESQGRILGFLVLQQLVNREWQPAELNIVEMVCAQIGNAIIQSQTLRQVQMLVDERTSQLQRSLEVQAKLYEKTRQYVEQLRELNELKDEFLSNMSDRLRYPLTNMRMAIRNLRQPSVPPERQVTYLDILEQQCTQEINLINDLLTLQKLESHQEPPRLQTIDLNTKIQDFAKSFEKKLEEKGLSISVDLPTEPLSMQTEVESFDRILQELLTNASRFSQKHTTVEVEVIQKVQDLVDRVIIKVTNTGSGISEEEATFIFDKFRRGKGRWTPGTGLGLALVKSIVQHLNGTISVESIPIEDTNYSSICFTLNLPQYSDESKP